MYDLEFSLPKDKLLHHHKAHGISFQGIFCMLAKWTQLYLLLEGCTALRIPWEFLGLTLGPNATGQIINTIPAIYSMDNYHLP